MYLGKYRGPPTFPHLPASPTITCALIGRSPAEIYSRRRHSALSMTIRPPNTSAGRGAEQVPVTASPGALSRVPHDYPARWCRFVLARRGSKGLPVARKVPSVRVIRQNWQSFLGFWHWRHRESSSRGGSQKPSSAGTTEVPPSPNDPPPPPYCTPMVHHLKELAP
ncbi:hypothetical protein CMUS01_12538 [Colletotrichum musicola]|uniref:Uncharacterized protein n=1 Tax=Colletotrichum musicola TaxID=2175873 RepID=A0A8H6JKP3_9PEZI|nr:hypothetical protein CMUS01_12538 [Colletotrichum musicola]